jgi:hypothetical protein
MEDWGGGWREVLKVDSLVFRSDVVGRDMNYEMVGE